MKINGVSFLSVLFLIVLSACHSSENKNNGWKAEWIGPEKPVLSEAAQKLENTSWIWAETKRSNAAVMAPETAVFFRKHLELSSDKPVKSATIALTADNSYDLFVNGVLFGNNEQWTDVKEYNIQKLLKSGDNLLAIRAENLPVYHTNQRGPGSSAAGLIASVQITFEDGSSINISTDESWKCSGQAAAGWETSGFSDADWNTANVLDKKGIATWEGPDVSANNWFCFRKTVNISEVPEQAIAKIAVDSKYWLWINGQLAVFEGGLKRGPNPNDTYYDEVELKDFLKEGANTIAVLVWHWGRNSFSHKNSGLPGLLFELNGKEPIVSDKSWKIQKHPAYGFTGAPHPNYRLAEYNIHYNASLGNDDWIQPDFNDEAWDQAVEFGVPPVSPWNNLVKRPIPQWFNTGLKEYAKVERVSGSELIDTVLAYLPTNAQITPYLKVNSPSGQTIDIRMDNYSGGSEYNIRSEYITREGLQEFEALAWMNGHVVKYTIPKSIEVLEVKYRETGYNAPVLGSFSCNEEFYNTLWQKSLRTLQVCIRDNYFDCPDRERAQWWGDAVIEVGQTFYALDRSADSLSRKAIYELVDWRKPDGSFYSPVPGGGWDSELPGQMLMSIGKYGFWNYFMHTGDTATIKYVYPAVKKYLNFWDLDKNGMVAHREGGWDWGDWGTNIDRRVLDQCYYTLALQSAVEMAKLTGHPEDVSWFEDRIESIKEGTNSRFWNGKAYRNPEYKGETDDRVQGLAVVAGIAGPEKYDAIEKVLQTQFYASPYTERYILDAFFMMGKPEQGLKRMKERFQVMTNSPYSTLYEGWGIGSKGYGGGTINHSWSGGPLLVLSERVAGIIPIEPGYKKFQLLPQPGDLKDISIIVPSVKGVISAEMKINEIQFTLSVDIPAETVCRAGVPMLKNQKAKSIKINGTTCWESGKSIGEGEKLNFTESELHTCFDLAPGSWHVVASY
jgi:alpha-L-rhamnosidase